MKYAIVAILTLALIGCGQMGSSKKADLYEASELSAMMREMVFWSMQAKKSLDAGEPIDSVPQSFYDLSKQTATRGEHEEAAFLGMVPAYTNALRGIERGDSQQFYYNASILSCKTCHSVYCGGPLDVIKQL